MSDQIWIILLLPLVGEGVISAVETLTATTNPAALTHDFMSSNLLEKSVNSKTASSGESVCELTYHFL